LENIKFKKQFILAKNTVNPFDWDCVQISDYKLHYHPELKVDVFEDNGLTLISIGDLFDYKNTAFSNREIIEELARSNDSFDKILQSSFKYSGTYILIYFNKNNSEFRLFNDNAAQREVYYIKNNKGDLIFGSQPNIINLIYPLTKDNSDDAIQFYNSDDFKKRKSFVCDSTNFTGLKHLKPNHYIDITKKEAIRFFPDRKLNKLSLEDGAEQIAEMIKGYVLSASKRYPLLIPVSAGWESRILLAASKDISDKCVYFVYKHEYMSDTHQDIAIPKKLFNLLNIPFQIIEYSDKIEPEISKQIKESISFPRSNTFKFIINVLLKKFPEFMGLNGNVSEVGRNEFERIYKATPQKIAVLEKYPNQKYAIKQYAKWLDDNEILFKKNGFLVSDMLYWEENCGNWVAKSKTETMVGQEPFSPFNSRELLIKSLSVKNKYRGKQNSILYKHIAMRLWKEVLIVPVNPSAKLRVIKLMHKLGVYSLYRNMLLNYRVFKASFSK
jgi:hypothetical protein